MSPVNFHQPIVIEGNACFLSDAHLGTGNSELRETLLCQFLEQQQDQIQHLFLLGDMFDFWFEYRDVVPKGYCNLFFILKKLQQKGIKIYYFTGNHDMWVQTYFTEQFGCQIFYSQQVFSINGKCCLIGHGDGLGGKQRKYLLIKNIFGFKPNRILYSMLHPRQAFSIARFCSAKSRQSHPDSVYVFKNEEEPQIMYAREVLQQHAVDYFIYAHRHIPMRYELSDQSLYFNTGDWLNNFSYLTFYQNQEPVLAFFKQD